MRSSGEEIVISIDGVEQLRIEDEELGTATKVGLYGRGDAALAARWINFTVIAESPTAFGALGE